MAASDGQVQAFVNNRIRPRAEAARSLLLAMADDIAVIDDIYNALNVDPTWSDLREDGPPHLLTPSDVLAINSFLHNVRDAIVNDPQYPVILKACVRPAVL